MRPEPPCLDDQQARPTRPAHFDNNLFGEEAEVRIGIVEAPCPESEGPAAALDVPTEGVSGGGRLRNPVVLHDEQGGHAPGRGQVQALVNQTLAQGPVADHD